MLHDNIQNFVMYNSTGMYLPLVTPRDAVLMLSLNLTISAMLLLPVSTVFIASRSSHLLRRIRFLRVEQSD